MSDQIQPSDQDPLENEAGASSDNQTNRPADQARVGRVGETEAFEWAGSDEATDFLGLNDAVGADGAAGPGADPYAMPGLPPADEAPRTNWLLNEAAQAAPQAMPGQPMPGQPMPGQPMPGQPGQPGAPGGGGNWLMDGQEPAPLPAPRQPEMPAQGGAQPAVATGSQQTDPNWLLSLDDRRANQGGSSPVVPGSQEDQTGDTPRGLEASFVDPEPPSRAFGRVVRRTLTGAAVLAGGLVMWQVLSHHGEADGPVADPVEIGRNTTQRQIERPLDHDPELGSRGSRTAITPESGSGDGTAAGPGGTAGGTRRWYSNVAPDSDGAMASEPAELDPDSYPWPAPTQLEVDEARSVLLAFDTLMGDVPLAQSSSTESGSYFERFANRMVDGARGLEPGAGAAAPGDFDSLTVVQPETLDQVGPPVLDGSGTDLPPVPRWTTLDERLVPADRSVLDQYYAWRLSGEAETAQRMQYVPRVGTRSSVEPTLELPYVVATIGAGEDFMRDGGPMPAEGFSPDRAGDPQVGTGEDLVAVGIPLDTTVEPTDTEALDPRRIEKDPLFSFQARVPGTSNERMTLENHWMGTNVPMQALDYPERVLTPRVGAVRVHHDNGEGFEGHLFAMGQGIVWVDTNIGRMTLDGDSIVRIERLDASRVKAMQDGNTPLAGLDRVRVKTPGGVIIGFELYREGDRITMLTETGYKITLPSDDVELANTARASAGIKRRGR